MSKSQVPKSLDFWSPSVPSPKVTIERKGKTMKLHMDKVKTYYDPYILPLRPICEEKIKFTVADKNLEQSEEEEI